MTTDAIKAAYAAELKETIIVRRYTGAGINRPHFDAAARARRGVYAAKDMVGTVQQGDTHVLVFTDDLIARGFALPVLNTDKVVVKGKELAIINPGLRKAPDGTVIVNELQARG
ncbi:MAG: hypothetical protein WDN48_06040 [Pseudolabrys sp.]